MSLSDSRLLHYKLTIGKRNAITADGQAWKGSLNDQNRIVIGRKRLFNRGALCDLDRSPFIGAPFIYQNQTGKLTPVKYFNGIQHFHTVN